MSKEKFEKILGYLNESLSLLEKVKEEVGEDKFLILNGMINKTEEAIHRWKFRMKNANL